MKKLLILVSLFSLIANVVFVLKLWPANNDKKIIMDYTVMINRINDANKNISNILQNKKSNKDNQDLLLYHSYLYLEESELNYRHLLPELQAKKISYDKFNSLFFDSKRYLSVIVGAKLSVNGSLDVEKLRDVERNLNTILNSLPLKIDKEADVNDLKEAFLSIQ